MARVVVITPNPAIDVTYRVDVQRLGETVRVVDATRRAGGKGINVARVLHALGRPVMAVQPLGGASGGWIDDELAAAGIDTVSVPTGRETRTTVAVVDGRSHPTLYSEPGAALDDGVWRALESAIVEHCGPQDILVIAGSFPPATTALQVASLVAAGTSAGALVVVDASGEALVAAADAGADILKPNESELLEATGTSTLDAGLAALFARGAGCLVISRGSAGLIGASADGDRVAQDGVPGVSGNPTGAGDAATAGLVAALADGLPLPEALRCAAITGAAAVLAPIAGVIDPADLPRLAARLDGGSFPLALPTAYPPTPR
ncbi:hexose kinase [Herbiconiux sp. CPCC 205763]|uniref:Hexose kinase n=1 Tax=Herbiconiux aconitum TaxID=2970913 RepID=A0ABT2GLS0_9MICO|nr:hexose kinase [Herbiconiux aconitum]MCS5717170.1 hexose kinase [Herbiconiux aconitum]